MQNLRAVAAADAKNLNIKDWSLPVEFITPEGDKLTTDAETGEPLKAIQIIYQRTELNPSTGEEIIINNPVVVMARNSFPSGKVPEAGERWFVKIPRDPDPNADLDNFVMSETRSPEGGRSLGFIRIYLQKVEQSE